jgi:hypothetical protein
MRLQCLCRDDLVRRNFALAVLAHLTDTTMSAQFQCQLCRPRVLPRLVELYDLGRIRPQVEQACARELSIRNDRPYDKAHVPALLLDLFVASRVRLDDHDVSIVQDLCHFLDIFVVCALSRVGHGRRVQKDQVRREPSMIVYPIYRKLTIHDRVDLGHTSLPCR